MNAMKLTSNRSMKMKAMKLAIPSLVALAVALAYGPSPALAAPITLGSTLSTFAVLGAVGVTNAAVVVDPLIDKTLINGNLGNSPGTLAQITGFGPTTSIVNGTIYAGTSGPAATAHSELQTVGIALSNLMPGVTLANTIAAGGLSGSTRLPGVYKVITDTAFDLGGTANLGALSNLTLQGDLAGTVAEQWLFLMTSALNVGVNTKVIVDSLGAGDSVYWLVLSDAVLHKNADFAGTMVVLNAITFDTGATDRCGKALAYVANVTFAGVGTTIDTFHGETVRQANQVGGGCPESGDLTGVAEIPEPEIYAMMGMGLGLMGWVARRRKQKAA